MQLTLHGQFLKTLPAGACALQLAHTPKKAAGEAAEEEEEADMAVSAHRDEQRGKPRSTQLDKHQMGRILHRSSG